MHYGSFFGGLYCVELNPETGLPVQEGDQGHLIARRATYWKDNLEAPEIIYNPELKQYYLFVSYDPLMTTYNVRVGRSDKAEGPFVDYFGVELKDTTNNFPILTAPYRFTIIRVGRVRHTALSSLRMKDNILWRIKDVCLRITR